MERLVAPEEFWIELRARLGGAGCHTHPSDADLPAPLAPLSEMRPLGAQRGVVAMARMDHRGIVKAVEDLPFKIIHQGGEVFWAVGLARASRK